MWWTYVCWICVGVWRDAYIDQQFSQLREIGVHHVERTIPDSTKGILVTHGPPLGILDNVGRGQHAGCPALLKRVPRLTIVWTCIWLYIHIDMFAYVFRCLTKIGYWVVTWYNDKMKRQSCPLKETSSRVSGESSLVCYWFPKVGNSREVSFPESVLLKLSIPEFCCTPEN